MVCLLFRPEFREILCHQPEDSRIDLRGQGQGRGTDPRTEDKSKETPSSPRRGQGHTFSPGGCHRGTQHWCVCVCGWVGVCVRVCGWVVGVCVRVCVLFVCVVNILCVTCIHVSVGIWHHTMCIVMLVYNKGYYDESPNGRHKINYTHIFSPYSLAPYHNSANLLYSPQDWTGHSLYYSDLILTNEELNG